MAEEYGERLAKIELAIITLQGQVTSLHQTLIGDGRDGLGIAVDRLEQAHQRMVWNYRLIGSALIGLVVKAVWELLTQPTPMPPSWPYMGFL